MPISKQSINRDACTHPTFGYLLPSVYLQSRVGEQTNRRQHKKVENSQNNFGPGKPFIFPPFQKGEGIEGLSWPRGHGRQGQG